MCLKTMTEIQDELAAAAPTAHSQVGSNDSQARKNMPMAQGLLDYFPAALAAVSHVSQVGNDKHNPGEPMHHARGKSMDHADCVIRHLADRGDVDEHGVRHSAYAAWRALALLQQELEDAGEAPLARGARLPEQSSEILELQAWGDGISVEPEGWRAVREGVPRAGDWYLYEGHAQLAMANHVDEDGVRTILERLS